MRKGFTLIELLVVIGILAVLLTITLIAINPARQFSQSNNTKRRSDILTILNAIGQYAADNKGALPPGINVGVATAGAEISNTATNLCTYLISNYVSALPVDPLTNNGTPVATCSGAYDTGYTVVKSASNSRITVTAPSAELNEVITVTR